MNRKNKDKISRLGKIIVKATEETFVDTGLLIITDSLNEAPVDTGKMRESARIKLNGKNIGRGTKSGDLRRVNKVVKKEKVENINISYNTPYALIQHEELSFYHPVGKAKYLEDPALKHLEHINEKMRRNMITRIEEKRKK